MKKILKAIWEEFIYGGHLLSLGATSIVATVGIIVGTKPDLVIILISYLGTHSVYLFDRTRGILKDGQSKLSAHLIKRKTTSKLIVSLYVSLMFFLLLLYSNIVATLWAIFIFGSGFLYTEYIKPISKKIPAFKNFFIPLPYFFLPILLLSHSNKNFELATFLLMIFIYIRLFIAVAFYDIKDIKEDVANGIKTFATIYSKKTLFVILNVLNIFSIIPLIYGVATKSLPAFSLALILTIPYFAFYTHKSKNVRDIVSYSLIFCDGEYLFWLPIILIARSLWN